MRAAAMRAMKLMFSEVLASPYCRKMETAQLMTGGAPHLAEGEAAVIRGDGSRWTIVARIPVADWPRLALGE